jgi:hypothetical protein
MGDQQTLTAILKSDFRSLIFAQRFLTHCLFLRFANQYAPLFLFKLGQLRPRAILIFGEVDDIQPLFLGIIFNQLSKTFTDRRQNDWRWNGKNQMISNEGDQPTRYLEIFHIPVQIDQVYVLQHPTVFCSPRLLLR